MSLEDNKAVARRYLQALREMDMPLLEQLFAPDFVDYLAGERLTREERLRRVAEEWATRRAKGYTSRSTIDEIIAEGDVVAVRYTRENIFDDPARPPAKVGRFTGMFFIRVRDGQMVEGWGEWDQTGAMARPTAVAPATETTSPTA